MVGKESSGMVRRGPQHWRLWLQEPWDVAKDDAVSTERPTCVAVKREGGTDRQGMDDCPPWSLDEGWECSWSCECSGRSKLGRNKPEFLCEAMLEVLVGIPS